jgi:XrtJ-associated TM-motif-TM protein
MHRSVLRLVVTIAFFAAFKTLHAQSGCNDSPEAPTEVLLAVGAAGLFFGPMLVRKLVLRKGRD